MHTYVQIDVMYRSWFASSRFIRPVSMVARWSFTRSWTRPGPAEISLRPLSLISIRKLTRPLRNMLTFLSLRSACSAGVDLLRAACTVCRICRLASASYCAAEQQVAYSLSESADQIGLFLFGRIDGQTMSQSAHAIHSQTERRASLHSGKTPYFRFPPFHLVAHPTNIVVEQVCSRAESGLLGHG